MKTEGNLLTMEKDVYLSPQIEMVETTVEKGFAMSDEGLPSPSEP